MAAATVLMMTYSDADFVKSFMLLAGDTYYDFTGMTMEMMIRRHPEDAEVYVKLSTDPGDGIILSEAVDGSQPGELTTINITIRRDQLALMPEGDYAHSLIMTRPDGLLDDIWRGTLTHQIGPTR